MNGKLAWALLALAIPARGECPPDPPPLLDPAFLKLVTQGPRCAFFTRHGMMNRPPLNSYTQGQLTPYWAQEMAGLDLAAGALAAYDAAHPQAPSRPVPVGILDGGAALRSLPRDRLSPRLRECVSTPPRCPELHQDDHSGSVGNLILGEAPVGGSSRARLTYVGGLDLTEPEFKAREQALGLGETLRRDQESLRQVRTVAEAFVRAPEPPAVVNLSYNFNMGPGPDTDHTLESLRQVAARTVLVQAAGNRFPDPTSPVTRGLNAITVGALDPDGLSSRYSQEGEDVLISAPSGSDIQTQTDIGEAGPRGLKSFSGTSGAAPLVTAAVANVQSLLPGIQIEELKTLLRKTAIATAAFAGEKKGNGAGALNGYQLVRVAERLRLRGWPENRGALGSDPALFDFSAEAAQARAAALSALQHGGRNRAVSCPDLEAALKGLRTAFFLEPGSASTREALGELYGRHGFEAQANYVRARTARAPLASLQERFAQARTMDERRDLALALISTGERAGMPVPLVPDHWRALSRPPDSLLSIPIYAEHLAHAHRISPEYARPIYDAIWPSLRSHDGARSELIREVFHQTPSPTGQVRFVLDTYDRHPDSRPALVYLIGKEVEDLTPYLPLFERAIHDPDARTAEWALSFIPPHLKPEDCRRILGRFVLQTEIDQKRHRLAADALDFCNSRHP